MKVKAASILTTILPVIVIPTQLNAKIDIISRTASYSGESSPVTVMLDRLNEMYEVVKSEISSYAKSHLRNELRFVKKQLMEFGGGVYLSVGLIIKIFLLIHLL